jgi:arsenate reductase
MRIVFLCRENSCRSQMAEALAWKFHAKHGVEFASAGNDPADEVDPGAVEILKEEGIDWGGHPKTLDKIGDPDIVVTMGCEVECPHLPSAKRIEWDIPDPKGKQRDDYQRVVRMIRDKLEELADTEGL